VEVGYMTLYCSMKTFDKYYRWRRKCGHYLAHNFLNIKPSLLNSDFDS
jgi:hypothetical protein